MRPQHPSATGSKWFQCQDKCQALRPKAWDFRPKQIFPLTRTGPKSQIVPGRGRCEKSGALGLRIWFLNVFDVDDFLDFG